MQDYSSNNKKYIIPFTLSMQWKHYSCILAKQNFVIGYYMLDNR